MTELLFRDDAYLRSCDATLIAADDKGLRFDRTVFYPTGGGQPGDTGVARFADGTTIAIVDAVKGATPDEVVHVIAPDVPRPAPGSRAVLELDWDRRHRLMRMHTCLHLLSAVLPYPVTGGQVSDGKGRLDFDMSEAPPDKDAITAKLNELVTSDRPVRFRWVTDAELDGNADLVKTMSVKPPRGSGRVRLIEVDGLDLQACGGTHVSRTGEIGPVRVRKIESKGRQNRRVLLEFEGTP
ncbi:alanyl-tRNA editing protein [Desertibaculum subflavum]|uniref:alanyl-tRNA editing protein n=1 Tax=Desertibaculum subflavum TaxID=2268458 RepID=UPI000E66F479